MRRMVAFSLALAGALVGGVPSRADPIRAFAGDSMNVQADRLEIDLSAGEALLTGNVSLSKGEFKVSCPRIDLRFDQTPNIKWARGSGGVLADVRGVHAEAPEAELDLLKSVLDLRGGVRLARGHGWLHADRATIDVASAKVSLTQVKGSIPVPPAAKP